MEIIGRDAELARLRATVDRAPGASPHMTLHGDPGTGKTTLLQAGVAHARARGVRVLAGSGYEGEARLSFAGLHQLLAPVLGYVDRVEPFHRNTLRRALALEAGSAPDRLAVSAASLAVLTAVAEDGPVLIAVDDTHRLDVPTREVLSFLTLRLAPYDLRVLLARDPLTGAERVSPGAGMLEVAPLADPAAGALLRLLHPGLPGAMRRRVLTEAAGNPLALTELPEALTQSPATSPAGTPPPTRLESGYTTRVLSLPPALRTALLLTVLDGERREHGPDDLVYDRAASTPGPHHLPHSPRPAVGWDRALPSPLGPYDLVEAERLGLVTHDSTPTGVRFRHPLVRSAIMRTASPDEVRRAHAALAER